jgi:uncharacterized protein
MILRGLLLVVRVVALLMVVRLVLRALGALARNTTRPATAGSRPGAVAVADLVRDRICNTFLPRDRALRAMVSGREEHFCSEACRDRALTAASQAS